MACYRNGGCGPYEMLPCSEFPASKQTYRKVDLHELDKLEKYLKENGVQYRRIDREGSLDEHGHIILTDVHQIICDEERWDAVCHFGSYGYNQGLLEIMGSLVVKSKDHDQVVGFLTADDVIARREGKA